MGLSAPRRCAGRTRKHSIRLPTIMAMTTKGMAAMISPMMSEMISSGVKAAMVVSAELITGAAMRRAPPSAAARASRPARRRASACSPTTMASSTTMPMAMMRPNRLIILIDWPLTSMTAMVAKREIGIPAATQNATRARKKTNRIRTTRTRPPRPLRSSRLIRPSIRSEAVRYCSTFRFGGRVGRSSPR